MKQVETWVGGIVLGPKVEKRDILRLLPACYLTLVMKRAMELVRHPNRCLPRMDLPEDSCSLWSNPVVKVPRRHRWSGSGEARSRMSARNQIAARLGGRWNSGVQSQIPI
jgi:hypothetical protein